MKKTVYDHWGIECGEGWKALYEPLIALCEREGVRVGQVKEKFGMIRFYVDARSAPIPKQIRDAIDAAEEASRRTCEKCGAVGELSRIGWMSVRCEPCRSKANDR